jgi:hypothetical protein
MYALMYALEPQGLRNAACVRMFYRSSSLRRRWSARVEGLRQAAKLGVHDHVLRDIKALAGRLRRHLMFGRPLLDAS